MSEERKIVHNQYDVEWQFAKIVANCLRNDLPVPSAPSFSIWEVTPKTGTRKLMKTKTISPMTVRISGKVYP